MFLELRDIGIENFQILSTLFRQFQLLTLRFYQDIRTLSSHFMQEEEFSCHYYDEKTSPLRPLCQEGNLLSYLLLC